MARCLKLQKIDLDSGLLSSFLATKKYLMAGFTIYVVQKVYNKSK